MRCAPQRSVAKSMFITVHKARHWAGRKPGAQFSLAHLSHTSSSAGWGTRVDNNDKFGPSSLVYFAYVLYARANCEAAIVGSTGGNVSLPLYHAELSPSTPGDGAGRGVVVHAQCPTYYDACRRGLLRTGSICGGLYGTQSVCVVDQSYQERLFVLPFLFPPRSGRDVMRA